LDYKTQYLYTAKFFLLFLITYQNMNFCSFEQPEFRCLLESFPLTKKLAVLSYSQKLRLSLSQI
jgi:hypothetical protein